MKNLILFVSLFLCLFVGVNDSFACSCIPSTPSKHFEKVDAVFIGEVTKVIKTERKWQVTVSQVLKGNVSKKIFFYAPKYADSCDWTDFELKTPYLFFADKIEESEIGQDKNGKVLKDDREMIGNYKPRVCSWSNTLTSWKSEDKRNLIIALKDYQFLEFLQRRTGINFTK